MNTSEFAALKVGDIVEYTQQTDYENTICEIISKDRYGFILYIFTPGKRGYTAWGDGERKGYFCFSNAYKFNILSSGANSLEERIIKKIKQLDTKWTQTQLDKGKTNALLCM